MKCIRLGSRESTLAVVQARMVMAAFDRAGQRTELVTMKTTGDRILDRPLDAIGGKGLFIKELDEALMAGRVDLCVHSYKDLPVPDNPDLPVVAVSRREDPRDVLVLPPGETVLRPGLPIGTSSARRTLQLGRLFPDAPCAGVRGNVHTRLRKLDSGEYAGLVLAAAGLKRLGLWHRASRVFTPEEMLPAAGQGMLAVQGRAGEQFPALTAVHCRDSADAAAAERSFIEALGATCSSPVAAHAVLIGDTLVLSGLNVGEDGRVRTGRVSGSRKQGVELGRSLALDLTKGSR